MCWEMNFYLSLVVSTFKLYYFSQCTNNSLKKKKPTQLAFSKVSNLLIFNHKAFYASMGAFVLLYIY